MISHRPRYLTLITALSAVIFPLSMAGCASLPDMQEAEIAKSEGRGEDAVRQWQELSDLGFPAATVKLGRAYQKGEGVKKSPAHAVELFALAADQGDVAAIFELGRAYQKGLGVRQNTAKAKEYYTLAKDMGYSRAATALEQMGKVKVKVKKQKAPAPAQAEATAAPAENSDITPANEE